MAKIAACTGCAVKPASCDFAKDLLNRLRGLRVSLVRHRCAVRVPLYNPGDAVMVQTVPYQNVRRGAYHEDDDHSEPPKCGFRGVFVRQIGTKAIAFITPGSEGEDKHGEKWGFETDGIGFVKVPLGRVALLVGEPKTDLKECGRCGELFGLTGRCDKAGAGWMGKRPCAAEEGE